VYGTPDEPVALDSWRPNIYIFRPQDYWGGAVDYVPWRLGDEAGCRPTPNGRGHFKEVSPGGGEQTGVDSSCTNKGHGHGDIDGWVASDQAGIGVNETPFASDDGFGCDVRGASASNKEPIEVLKLRGCAEGEGEGEVETALHGVLDALRRVRAVRENLR